MSCREFKSKTDENHKKCHEVNHFMTKQACVRYLLGNSAISDYISDCEMHEGIRRSI